MFISGSEGITESTVFHLPSIMQNKTKWRRMIVNPTRFQTDELPAGAI
jgi:formate/nitrite transporter FocA (FNT family)